MKVARPAINPRKDIKIPLSFNTIYGEGIHLRRKIFSYYFAGEPNSFGSRKDISDKQRIQPFVCLKEAVLPCKKGVLK